MNKKNIDALMIKANAKISPLFSDPQLKIINSTFDGKTSAFGVSLATMGLKPTLAMYYNESDNSSVSTRKILEVIARMLSKDSAKSLVQEAIMLPAADDEGYKTLYNQIKECAIALKMVIRTYPQKKEDQNE